MTLRTTLAAAAAAFALAMGQAQAAPITFTNSSALAIPDFGASSGNGASSTITVSGLTGVITDIDVRLNGLTHPFSGDLEIFLEGPLGQIVLLVNNLGLNNAWVSNTVTFSDGATALTVGAIGTDGTFAPNNDGAFCIAPDCATAGTALSVFNGTNPNGTWTLRAFDDVPSDVGGIDSGWSLIITTAATTPVPEPASLALLGAGLAGLTLARRRRRA